MRLKLIEDITAAQTERLSRPRVPLASFEVSTKLLENMSIPRRIEHRLGVRLAIYMAGEPKDVPEMMTHARSAIAHAVYGEVSGEIRAALQELWEEGFGVKEVPVRRLARLLDLLEGYDVPEDLKDY